jgi:hypothetical protein
LKNFTVPVGIKKRNLGCRQSPANAGDLGCNYTGADRNS